MEQRGGIAGEQTEKKTKAERALELALEIRKFEIKLYWKRATYFWAFLAVALAGYLTVLDAKNLCPQDKADALLVVSCLGVIFSLAWYFVNRGSKFWQENWEKHVDLLENGINGPLYKTILSKANIRWWKITDPWPFSVSRINQLLSLFITLIFLALTTKTVVNSYQSGWLLNWLPILVIILTFVWVIILAWGGLTDQQEVSMTETEYRKAFGLEISEEVLDQETIRVRPMRRKTKIL
jgi:hypothetical protein